MIYLIFATRQETGNRKHCDEQTKISPDRLSSIRTIATQLTLRIYKLSILLNFTPNRWKDGKIIFIPKPGKPRYDIAKSWRPITLTNYLLKGLERLCGWKMDEALTRYPVHTYQHGFRTDRNTETAISGVVDYIEEHI